MFYNSPCLCLSVCRKWVEDAYEESSEDEGLPSDEDDQKRLTTRWTNQTTVHSELQYCSQTMVRFYRSIVVVSISITVNGCSASSRCSLLFYWRVLVLTQF